MTFALRIALILAAVLATTMPAAAAKPMKPDCAAALASVQAVVAGNCDCAAATSHGQYVRCAAQVVKGLVADGTLGKTCKGAMVRTFAKSSCGKAGTITCCVPREPQFKCLVKKAATCERLGGVPGLTPFCADACVPASPSGAFID
jgi:hypothetical protein